VTPLAKKLLRDLWGMRGQAIAIALVIVSGVATFVAARGTMDALLDSRDAFYASSRFGDAFVQVKRAPEAVSRRLEALRGVGAVQTRVVADARLEVPAFDEPVTGRLLSLPARGDPTLNRLVVREGRRPRPGREAEAVVSEAFADAHRLHAGDTVTAIINGRRRSLTVVGVVLSPEYVYQIQPGGFFPAPERFGVLWMPRPALAAAYDMEGAFNSASFSLTSEAAPQSVLDRIDQVLEPYGGHDAYLREDQVSNRFLTEELRQLEQLVTVLPITFLGVAAFLLNVVLSRLIRTQREVIATLKAFGYGDRTVGLHYVGMVLVIVLLGSAGGVAVGAWMGHGLASLYLEFYRLPELHYSLGAGTVLIAVGVTALASVAGTLHAVRQAVRLEPAEAMRPEPPATYRPTILERVGWTGIFDQPTRMMIRHLERRPVKALLSVVGIALSVAILMTGTFTGDALDFMVDVQFHRAQRHDVAVTFTQPTSDAARYELQALPGVQAVEPFRTVPARLKHGPRSYRTGIEGLTESPALRRPLNIDLEPVDLAPAGIVLSEYLAGVLAVQPGDTLTVSVLEGARPTRRVRVAGRTQQFIGVGAYMQIDALNRLVREGGALSGAYLAVDPALQAATIATLSERPRVASVEAQGRVIQSFLDTIGETTLTFTFIMTLFAGAIAFGVVYNAARIALSERARELASLRVLGLTRGEIGYILLSELAILTLVAIPVGFAFGYALCYGVSVGAQTELFRIPLVIHRSTYAFSAVVVLAASLISGLVVWRRLGRLDLIEVLKTRE
jgi:putative ABC transport system permease protein